MAATVFWVPGPWRGRLAIVPRPRGGDWLGDETGAWRNAGIDMVVSLLEPEEEAQLVLEGESATASATGIEFTPFPIPDRGVPPSHASVAELVNGIRRCLGQRKERCRSLPSGNRAVGRHRRRGSGGRRGGAAISLPDDPRITGCRGAGDRRAATVADRLCFVAGYSTGRPTCRCSRPPAAAAERLTSGRRETTDPLGQSSAPGNAASVLGPISSSSASTDETKK